jgi:uncharacterized cupredoxin-like copper-binding protein
MRSLFIAVLFAYAPLAVAHGEASHGSQDIDYANAEPTPFGTAADPRKAKRTIRVDMTDDMRFTPAKITVKPGEVVRFVAANKGKVLHEMVLGRMEDLKQHSEMMRKHPGMEHDEPHMAHVAPGRSGEIGWRFTEAGTYYYGCLVPGHFEAGMIGRIDVKQ